MPKYVDDEIRNMDKITCKISADYLGISPLAVSFGMQNGIPVVKCEKNEPQYSYSEETLSFLDEDDRNRVLKSAADLHITANQTKYHRVLKNHEKDVQRWIKNAIYDSLANRKHERWWKRPEGMPAYLESVSVEAFKRIYPVVNALFNAIENLGWAIC